MARTLNLLAVIATPTAGMCPFSIAGIERELLARVSADTSSYWRIPVNWPSGHIEFEAPSFTQRLIGTPKVQAQQELDPLDRNDGNAN